MILSRFYQNHVLANLTFILVLVMGLSAYLLMPREQDPTINFNWISITTLLPGAAAEDVEKRVTAVLEKYLRSVSDIRFVSSVSREGIAELLVRFEEIDSRTFDKRVSDLRREVQHATAELPSEATTPFIFEVTTANAYPSAVVAVVGQADDENLRRQARLVREDLEQIRGVDRLLRAGMHKPELQVLFDPERLEAAAVAPTQLADTVSHNFRDLAAGNALVEERKWLFRIIGANADPVWLSELPLLGQEQELTLGMLAEVQRGRATPTQLVRYQGRPAVMLSVTKQEGSNTLELLQRINDFIAERNRQREATGVELVLIDDQTEITRRALSVMQTNALLGLGLVLLVTWIFLGIRIALLTTLGIPFILAGTFWLISSFGFTLNITVLLGVVISLGMLVDDAVVVAEAIYYRMQRGLYGIVAILEALREVVSPVTTAVLTTIAAFLPLMLLPGILGQFMMIVPLVVSIALAISLVEAYWMLPSHILAARVDLTRPSRSQQWRTRMLHRIRIGYTRLLIKAMRIPRTLLASAFLLFLGSLLVVLADPLRDPFTPRFVADLAESYVGKVPPGEELAKAEAVTERLRTLYPTRTLGYLADHGIRFDFFASDPIRLFYINLTMPAGTPLESTLATLLTLEQKAREQVAAGEVRNIISYAGQMFSETAPFFGDHYGQVLIALQPWQEGLRSVDEMIEAMRPSVMATAGPDHISFLRVAGGPPTTKPIVVKVRGEEIEAIRAAAAALQQILRSNPAVRDITDDDSHGQLEVRVRINQDAARRAGIPPLQVMRSVRLLLEGEVVAVIQENGEELEVRVRAHSRTLESIDQLAEFTLTAANGSRIPLYQLLEQEVAPSLGSIRRYNFRRTITVEADIDRSLTDTVSANQQMLEGWRQVQSLHPGVDLDLSGELDDIKETLDHILVLFLFGIGLMYLILGTQFRSYFQPFMILATVPMAFTGVVAGLVITQNPLSLYTLYGVVALAGIAVNAAIVLISAANQRLAQGMSLLHATLYAARRRVIPILITSLTTVAGLFSLATGLGGKSLLWGPVATAIVWGLVVSTLLTLFVIPLLYRIFMVGAAANMPNGR